MHPPVLLRADAVLSSLQLQKLLYFNFYFSPVFAAAHVALCVYKTMYLSPTLYTSFILPLVVAIWGLCEIPRLRLGYVGNLREKVPELSAFFLLTIFPSTCMVIYLTFLQRLLLDELPLDLGVGLPMLAFNILELPYAYKGVATFIRKQTGDFYRLCQEESWAGAVAAAKAEGALPPTAVAVVLRSLATSAPSVQRSLLGVSDATIGGPLAPHTVGAQAAASVGPAQVAYEGARHLWGSAPVSAAAPASAAFHAGPLS